MEQPTLPRNRKINRTPTKFGDKSKHVNSMPYGFRLSNLDVKPKVLMQSKKVNEFLYNLNLKYSNDFDDSIEILPCNLTDYLVSNIAKVFSANINDMSFNEQEKELIIQHSLEFDLYPFNIKPFMSLRYNSMPLFKAFATFVINSSIVQLEVEDTNYFYEDLVQFFIEELPLNESKAILKSYTRATNAHNLLRQEALTEKEAIKLLENYRPKNKTYILIKKRLLNWLNNSVVGCMFSSPPVEHYFDDDFIDNSEFIQVYERTFFCYDDNSEFYEAVIDPSLSERFNNYGVCSPASYISLYDNLTNFIKDDIERFEQFSYEYIDTSKLLNNTK